ncbi:MAG: SAM-dependent methyltransferase [Dermatophilaceae bacterium]
MTPESHAIVPDIGATSPENAVRTDGDRAEGVAFEAVLRRSRATAFGEEFVGQESFVTRSEILALGRAAGIGPGVEVLDLCCGTAGPGLLLAARLGCAYRGVDERPSAVTSALRRARAQGVSCRISAGRVPPLPPGRADVVLLLETLLAFPDKGPLLQAVAAALPPGGRFALTVEAGPPLGSDEVAAMPGSHTVWPIPLDELVEALAGVGLEVRWQREWTGSHRRSADALADAYERATAGIRDAGEREAVGRLVTGHRLWSRWLGERRVRKYALVAERSGNREPACTE